MESFVTDLVGIIGGKSSQGGNGRMVDIRMEKGTRAARL
jgi:hypothetical protein